MGKAIKVGDKVRFVDKKAHEQIPEYYPSIGTIGTVVRDECNPKDWKIQWPKGTTSGDDRWYCGEESIELFDGKIEKNEMTNEEIWKMLKPKMDKNGLTPYYSPDYYCKEEYYYESDVINAIAIAYRSGYERCMKGRPFKFGEKKKKQGGHWEPVDPNNLPKEGTKVRYARHIDDMGAQSFSEWTGIQIGEVTTVKRVDNEFWVEDIHNENEGCPLCSFLHPERFDMWVEDDE